MKKFIILAFLMIFSAGLFAKDFYVHETDWVNNDIHQAVFLTQEKNGAQYSVFVMFKNQNEDFYTPLYVISFHSQTDNMKAYKQAKECFDDVGGFIKTHNSELLKGRITNSRIDYGAFTIKIANSRPLMYNCFEK